MRTAPFSEACWHNSSSFLDSGCWPNVLSCTMWGLIDVVDGPMYTYLTCVCVRVKGYSTCSWLGKGERRTSEKWGRLTLGLSIWPRRLYFSKEKRHYFLKADKMIFHGFCGRAIATLFLSRLHFLSFFLPSFEGWRSRHDIISKKSLYSRKGNPIFLLFHRRSRFHIAIRIHIYQRSTILWKRTSWIMVVTFNLQYVKV